MNRLTLLVIGWAIGLTGVTIANANPFPPASREVKIVDRDPLTGAKTTVTVLVGATDRLYMTRHEVAVIHTDGTESETVLQDPRNVAVSRSK